MRTSNIGRAALVAAGAVAVGAAFGSGLPATADTTTSGNFSVLGGNQVAAPISVPVEASGNAVGVIGAAQGQSKGGAHVSNARHGGGGGDMHTSGNFSIGGGNQVKLPISIPVDVCGNAVAIIGLAKAACKGGASVTSGKKHHHHHGWRESSANRKATGAADDGARYGGGWGKGGGNSLQTSGNFSILGGNQVYAPISVPVNVCGNAVAVLGLARAKCKGGASVQRRAGDPKMKTSGNFSILGGNQVYAPISIPVDVCGNAIAILGLAEAQCKGGATVGETPGKKPHKPHKPHKPKPYKPSKHRPAAKHEKLPSNKRAGAEMDKGKAELKQGKSILQRSKASLGSGDARTAGTVPSASNARPATNARMATTRSATRPKSGEQLGGVQRFVNSLKRAVKIPGVDVKPGKLGPKLPTKGAVPVKLGTPVTR